jgi:hypothetical protein
LWRWLRTSLTKAGALQLNLLKRAWRGVKTSRRQAALATTDTDHDKPQSSAKKLTDSCVRGTMEDETNMLAAYRSTGFDNKL